MFPDPSSFESHADPDDSNHNQTVSQKNSLVWGEALALPFLFPDKVHGCIEPRMPGEHWVNYLGTIFSELARIMGSGPLFSLSNLYVKDAA